mgnify:FL=1|tara:strand:+ start:892 stop:1086 length:195 start_codon:yes stop_codon:yes gene_type:complete
MSDSKKGIWNGGKTFENKYGKLIRESEDYYDTIDSELEDREDIKNNKKRIRKPYHELYNTKKEK